MPNRTRGTSRRTFVKGGLLAGASLPLVGGDGLPLARRLARKPILVVVEVRGGWDYLSMIVPANDPNYRRLRPRLAIARGRTLSIIPGLPIFWHPALAAFKNLFDRGDLAVVNNVGYPDPDLSHFVTRKKWHAGDASVTKVQTGWLGRYLNSPYCSPAVLPAINLSVQASPAFKSARVAAMTALQNFRVITDPSTSADHFAEVESIGNGTTALTRSPDPLLSKIAANDVGVMSDAQYVQQLTLSYTPAVTYPPSTLGGYLLSAAQLIVSGVDTQVYYTEADGFDTHASQANEGAPETGLLAYMLQDVADSVAAFLDDLRAQGRGSDVVVMVLSEFGRRVAENGALGTDHGTGGVAFLAGAPVRGGVYGQFPNLSNLTSQGNIPFDSLSTDFRSLYATVLERWLGAPSAGLLNGSFPLLGAL